MTAAGTDTPPGDGAAETAAPAHPHIRSFALRRGRVTQAQRRACEEILPRLALAYRPAPLDLDAAFGRHAPTVLEIGFGMGETTAKPISSTVGAWRSASAWARPRRRSRRRGRT